MQISNTEVIENLGAVDLVVADKTGTITMNELILREIYADKKVIKFAYSEDSWT